MPKEFKFTLEEHKKRMRDILNAQNDKPKTPMLMRLREMGTRRQRPTGMEKM